ncbi:MAG: response regulator, partial [Lachnospiraceae bacterium]|nr:response regulator [Lachnospiraceae bacterium]
TGIGIKEEDMDKIFQSFQQVDSKRNRNIEGTGLGLAITKNLLSLMYGTIMVQSVYGKGSKFSFTLQQRIVSSASACEIPNADTIYSAGLLVNAYQRSQLYRDVKRLGVYYKKLKSESELEEQAEAGLQFLFLDTNTFTPSVEDFVRNHPDITTIVLIPFNKKLDTDLPNIKVVHEPLYAWNLAMIFRGESLHSLRISGDDMDLDFVAPDANILIVDDNAINLTVAEGLLKPLQMKIDTALSGKEAIEKISEKQYDMIFMDHMMPELDGVETTHIIRRMHPEYDMVPIIALTANVVEETRFMFLSEGMNDFVAKPIELRMIISVIKRWLPSEKLKPLSAADLLPETTQSTAPSSQTSLEIGDLDTASALQLLGSEDLLWMVLKDYYTVIDKKIALIKNYQLNEEWKNYTTEVHALKSASKQIGAMELSEKAAALEKAGNDLNIEMIQERTDDMLEQYRGYQELLAPYFTEEKEETDSSDLPDIDKDLLKEILHTLSDAVTNLDLDQLEQSVQELSNYALEETHAALFKKLKTAVEELDFEACDSVLLDWITLL